MVAVLACAHCHSEAGAGVRYEWHLLKPQTYSTRAVLADAHAFLSVLEPRSEAALRAALASGKWGQMKLMAH